MITLLKLNNLTPPFYTRLISRITTGSWSNLTNNSVFAKIRTKHNINSQNKTQAEVIRIDNEC